MKAKLKYILVLVGLAVVAFLLMDFTNRVSEASRLRRKKAQIELQLTEVVRTQAYLDTQVAYATSDEAVMEYIYTEKQMVQPGDIRVVPMPVSQPSVTPVPTPIIPAAEYKNWQYWWALFFDPRP